MKIMKLEIWEMIQKALHKNELLVRSFMASKPNEVAHDHNHGMFCSNDLRFGTWVHHALPMNVYIVPT